MNNKLTFNGVEYELIEIEQGADYVNVGIPNISFKGKLFYGKAIVDKQVSQEVEKEWEVISFRDGIGVYIKKENLYVNGGLVCPFVPSAAEILSVKRLSDGEVFSIGDYVDMISAHKITRIIIGGAPQNTIRDVSLVWLSTSDAPYLHGVDLMCAKKYKPKSIFKTHDGVEYFEGQENNLLYSVVPKATWETSGEVSVLTAMSRQNSNWIYFSTKEAMDKYIFAYKPYLSYEDVIKFILQENVGDSVKGLMVMHLTDFLKQKVNGL